MSKINLVLDLDNTIISSISTKEMKSIKNIDKRNLDYKDMDDYYRVFYRPGLADFLKFAFANFDVSIWTAASREYATFIINEIILKDKRGHHIPNRKLKMFLYDQNCDQSQEIYDKNSPKDLRYLYNFKDFHPCNTIIMDDLNYVRKANPKQTIPAVYFDAKKKQSENDNFLTEAKQFLIKIKHQYENGGCALHRHE